MEVAIIHSIVLFFFFMYGNFNAQEEHKGWTVTQSANSGVLPIVSEFFPPGVQGSYESSHTPYIVGQM